MDEGHTLRNEDTEQLVALKKVETSRKILLSGTIYQNHVREVFNLLNLVRPRFLKLEASKALKRSILCKVQISKKGNKLKMNDDDFYELVEYALEKDENLERRATIIQDLRKMTSKVLHYYKGGESLDELPGLVDLTVFLNLSPRQKYELFDLKRGRNFKSSADSSLIYVHPELKNFTKQAAVRDRVDQLKFDDMLERLDETGVKAKFYLNLLRLCEASGEKLLIFSQYVTPLKFLETLTAKIKGWSVGKELFMITGDSVPELRETYMMQFNNSSDAKVFFGSIKACGERISLVGASRIIILDVHLNPSVTRQAIGRAFGPGQMRKVFTYRLVAASSPEEDDHSISYRKESIAKQWFEWDTYCNPQTLQMQAVSVQECGDIFLETSLMHEDVVSLYKR